MNDTAFFEQLRSEAVAEPLCGYGPEQHKASAAKLPEFQAEALDALNASADRLYNDRIANGTNASVRQAEAPHHRMMLLLRAKGFSHKEIAEVTGYTAVCVSQVLRQPWARKWLNDNLHAPVREIIAEYIETEAIASLQTLVELRDDPDVPPHVRSLNCDRILDRYLGKPTAHIETTHHEAMPNSVEELQLKLDALKAEAERLHSN